MTIKPFISCSIISCDPINDDVYRVIINVLKTTRFKYQAGQYTFIQLTEDDSRPYSIASVTDEGPTLNLHLHIRKIEDNDFTGQLIHKLNTADQIKVSEPYGNCTIQRSHGNRPLLFIAGGTGFAPCHAIIQSLIETDDCRSITLYWGANSASDFYLMEAVNLWIKERDNFLFVPVIASPDGQWQGETGMVHEAALQNISKIADYDIYIAGSSAMVLNVNQQLMDHQVPAAQIFSDMLDMLEDHDTF